jgi:hypothetical protein
MAVKYERRHYDEGQFDPREHNKPVPLNKIPYLELQKDPYSNASTTGFFVYHPQTDQRFSIPEEIYLKLFPETPKPKALTLEQMFNAAENGVFVEEDDEEEPEVENNIFNMSAEDIAKARLEMRQ